MLFTVKYLLLRFSHGYPASRVLTGVGVPVVFMLNERGFAGKRTGVNDRKSGPPSLRREPGKQ